MFWLHEPYYTPNKQLVDWMRVVLIINWSTIVLNSIIGCGIAPCIFRESLMTTVAQDDAPKVSSLKSRYVCRAKVEFTWAILVMLTLMFLAVYSIVGIVYLCGNNFSNFFK